MYAKHLAELAANLGLDGCLVINFPALFGTIIRVYINISIDSFFLPKLMIDLYSHHDMILFYYYSRMVSAGS